jgi:hypothetical protein
LFPIEDNNSFEDEKTFIKMFEEIYPVRREKKVGLRIKKFNLASFSQLQENPNNFQGI